MPIKYPIDDLLVQPAADDPVFTPRPPPTRDFNIPMECVGDVLMVWDFCCSYSKLLNLSPFSLDDFENALCHKDSNIVLIVEAQSALLRLLIKDNGDYFIALQKKKRKSKVEVMFFFKSSKLYFWFVMFVNFNGILSLNFQNSDLVLHLCYFASVSVLPPNGR